MKKLQFKSLMIMSAMLAAIIGLTSCGSNDDGNSNNKGEESTNLLNNIVGTWTVNNDIITFNTDGSGTITMTDLLSTNNTSVSNLIVEQSFKYVYNNRKAEIKLNGDTLIWTNINVNTDVLTATNNEGEFFSATKTSPTEADITIDNADLFCGFWGYVTGHGYNIRDDEDPSYTPWEDGIYDPYNPVSDDERIIIGKNREGSYTYIGGVYDGDKWEYLKNNYEVRLNETSFSFNYGDRIIATGNIITLNEKELTYELTTEYSNGSDYFKKKYYRVKYATVKK